MLLCSPESGVISQGHPADTPRTHSRDAPASRSIGFQPVAGRNHFMFEHLSRTCPFSIIVYKAQGLQLWDRAHHDLKSRTSVSKNASRVNLESPSSYALSSVLGRRFSNANSLIVFLSLAGMYHNNQINHIFKKLFAPRQQGP